MSLYTASMARWGAGALDWAGRGPMHAGLYASGAGLHMQPSLASAVALAIATIVTEPLDCRPAAAS